MLYIKKVGDYSLSQNAALAGIQLARPLGCYTWFLAGKLKQSPTTVFSSKPSFSSQSHTESKPHTKKVSKKRFNPDSQSNQGSSNGSDFGSQKKTKKSKTKQAYLFTPGALQHYAFLHTKAVLLLPSARCTRRRQITHHTPCRRVMMHAPGNSLYMRVPAHNTTHKCNLDTKSWPDYVICITNNTS